MVRTHRPFAFAFAFAFALASCAGGPSGGGRTRDDAAVNEHVRRVVARFTYGGNGPYAGAPAGGNVLDPAPGGPFEGAESPGLVGPPSADGGAYDRSDACEALCGFVAGCFAARVPPDCVSSCSGQVQLVARQFGDGCAGPVSDLYACIAGSLVCGRDDGGQSGDDDDDGGNGDVFTFSPDVSTRCRSALEGLRGCINRPDVDFDDLLDD